MDRKKGIILAVIIFLLIGLGTFVFANPSDGLNGTDNEASIKDSANDTSSDGSGGEEKETNVANGEYNTDNGNSDTSNVSDAETAGNNSVPSVLTLNSNGGTSNGTSSDSSNNNLGESSSGVFGGDTINSSDNNNGGSDDDVSDVYDNEAPVRTYLGIVNITHHRINVEAGTILEDVTVANIGDEVRVLIYFAEELGINPTVKIVGYEEEYIATYREQSSNPDNNSYAYYADITITEEMHLSDGEIKFEVYGYADKVGNVGDPLTNANINYTKYNEVVLDTTAPTSKWVYILNNDDRSIDGVTKITDGQILKVEINVDEELIENPTLVIGDYSVTLKRRANDDRFIYEATFAIDADKMDLVNTQIIKFSVNITDLAGNTTKLNNDDVTPHEEKGYDQVVYYDSKAPVRTYLGIVNITHHRINVKAGTSLENVTVANIGDEVRVLIYFAEELGINPTVKIVGYNEEYIATYREQSSNPDNNSYAYYADITITEEMNLSDGEIKFEVYGYADKVGNVGTTLTNANINYTKYNKVVLETDVSPFTETAE